MPTTSPAIGTRERMLRSAVALLQQRGANALTVDAVLAASGAPRGSVYHHFPGGRDQILLEATELASALMTSMLERAGSTPTELIDQLAAYWKEAMAASDYQSGCPVAAVVVDGHQASEAVSLAATAAFATWSNQLSTRFVRAGIDAAQAQVLASITLSTIEGALIQTRIRRDLAPIDEAAAFLKQVVIP